MKVIDLCDLPPECGLEWCHLLPHVTFRVLAAGGDGTVGWILSAIDNLKLKVRGNNEKWVRILFYSDVDIISSEFGLKFLDGTRSRYRHVILLHQGCCCT